MEGDGWNLERGPLGLPRPLESGVEMWVEGVGPLACVAICIWRDKSDRRVIHSLLLAVGIRFDLPLNFVVRFLCHDLFRIALFRRDVELFFFGQRDGLLPRRAFTA